MFLRLLLFAARLEYHRINEKQDGKKTDVKRIGYRIDFSFVTVYSV
jgi:hypothetical protein